jgi:sugar phosphate isomerase/epimerase
LRGIEWGGDVHVPPGDFNVAREVREFTIESGLSVAGYGSYYRAGQSEPGGVIFERVLDTAVELGAPVVRVWAGTAGSEALSDEARWKIIEDLRRITALAARVMISISVELHSGTLTDTPESASQLMIEVDRPNFLAVWQPFAGEEVSVGLQTLRGFLPCLGNVHVSSPSSAEKDHPPLATVVERWQAFLDLAREAPGDRFALLKCHSADSAESFQRDAATLKAWLTPVTSSAVR